MIVNSMAKGRWRRWIWGGSRNGKVVINHNTEGFVGLLIAKVIRS